MSLHKVISAAGCGKTTDLLNRVEQLLLEGVPPSDIVFTTFTRAGAHEARDRACKKFGLSRQQLPWFRTLHSLCHSQTPDLGRYMTGKDWITIANALGLFITLGNQAGSTKGDALMRVYDLHRLLLLPVDHVRRLSNFTADLHLAECMQFIQTVTAYKNENNCRDFTDTLSSFLTRPSKLRPKWIFVDEAQDINPLQWSCILHMVGPDTKIVMAGDDDQCVYEYAGARPDILIDALGTSSVLPVSHRLPRAVHELSKKITARISKRIPKNIGCRDAEGEVLRFSLNGKHPPYDNGETWFILARNGHLLQAFDEELARLGIPYINENAKNNWMEDAIRAVRIWKYWQTYDHLDKADAEHLYTWLPLNHSVKRGYKTVISKMHEEDLLSFEDATNQYGLLAGRTWHWREVFKGKLHDAVIAWVVQAESKGFLDTPPKVILSTIHGVKGREADNVVILPDMTPATFENLQNNPDSEHRVWYVAVTRARHRVWLAEPITDKHYEL